MVWLFILAENLGERRINIIFNKVIGKSQVIFVLLHFSLPHFFLSSLDIVVNPHPPERFFLALEKM